MVINKMANRVDPDEIAHLAGLHCLHRYLNRSTGLKRLPITKTYLKNFDPLKSYFKLVHVKPGFTGVYIIFLISAQKHRLWVLVRATSARRLYRAPTQNVLSTNMKKYQRFFFFVFFFLKKSVLEVCFFSIYLNRHVLGYFSYYHR